MCSKIVQKSAISKKKLQEARMPKECNFIAPLTLIKQFLIAIFFHFRALYNVVRGNPVPKKQLLCKHSSTYKYEL